MSNFEPDQLIASQKSNVAALFSLTDQAFESFQQIVKLNLQAVWSALDESQAWWQGTLSVKTPEEYITEQTDLLRPAAGQALSYSDQLRDIVSNAQAEWTKFVEAQYEHHSRITQTLPGHLV